MTVVFRDEMLKAVARLKSNLKDEQQRGALPRETVFREFVNGQVLYRGEMARKVIEHYGPGRRPDDALKGCIDELRGLCDPQTTGLTIAITLDEIRHEYIFVFVYIQP